MKVSLPTLRSLLGVFTLLLISGCSDDSSSSSSSSSDLNTVNLYFTDNEIRSFNPYTGQSTIRTKYDEGKQTLITLNTDNDKQGYEFVIYTKNKEINNSKDEKNKIYSMDSETLKESPLADFDGEVCIFPNAVPDQTAFEGSTKGERILVDQTSIFVIPSTNGECDKDTTTITNVDFTDKNQIDISQISAAHFWGDTLLDDTYTPPDTNNDEDSNDPGRYGFLGYNNSSQQLNFYDHENNTLWETPLPFVNSLPTIQQATQTEVLVQVDGILYLKNIAKLFDLAIIDSDPIPAESRVAAEFNLLTHTLTETNIDNLQVAGNGSTFALVDDGEVWFYDEELKEFGSLTSKNNSVLAVKIKMTDDGTLLVHRTFANSESLARIDTISGAEETIVDANIGNKISFHTQDNNIYINIFSQTGWQADWINAHSSRESFNNSLFTFSKNSRSANAETEIFLISSDEESSSDGYLTKPNLYAFDPANRVTGRKQNKDGNNSNKDFIFGEFSVDVKAISNSEIINDVYGRLELNVVREIIEGIDSDVTDTYFFNPSETDSLEDVDTSNKALQLIYFEEDVI